MSVFVKNGSGADFTDRFNGEDWFIPNGGIVELSLDAASHLFGYGIANKMDLFARLGWIKTNADFESAQEKLSKFSFFTSYEDASNSGEVASGDASSENPAPVSAAAPEPLAPADGEGQQADYAYKRQPKKPKPNLLAKLGSIEQE